MACPAFHRVHWGSAQAMKRPSCNVAVLIGGCHERISPSVTGSTSDVTLVERGVTCQTGDVDHAFVSGNLALDFVGTLKWRRRSEPEDSLDTPAALGDWLAQSGLLDVARTTRSQLQEAVRLREAIYRAAQAALVGEPYAPEDVVTVNAAAARPPVTPVLNVDCRRRTAGTVYAALSSIARAAIDVLGSEVDAPIKECGRDECTRIYLDRSRGHRRTWCGMDECGNRVNAAAYRQRQAAKRAQVGHTAGRIVKERRRRPSSVTQT